jgi:hypothetical protein
VTSAAPWVDYPTFIAAAQPIVDAYKAGTGRDPAWSDQRHWHFCILRLGWRVEQVLAALAGGVVKVDEPPYNLAEYQRFVGSETAEVVARYIANHPTGNPPAPSDLAHNSWRRLCEGYTQPALLAAIGPKVPTGSTPDVITPPSVKPTRVSGPALLRVRGNFCNLRDSRGAIVYTPAMTGAPESILAEWLHLQADAGSTHLPFGPPLPGKAYPGVAWENPDFYADPLRLRAFVERLLDTPAADGQGFRPMLFLGGDTFAESRFNRWAEIAAILDGLHQYLILLVAWEPVVGGWTSAEVSRGTERLRQLFPSATLAGHGSPTRWVSSSNPVEADDPWQGGEAEFFKSHGGQYLDGWFYQTPHGRDLYRPCTCPDSPKGQFTHVEECWLNRFEDGVARLGDGYHGWRKLQVVLYETVAYEAFRGQATPEQARSIATMGQKVARKWGVDLAYGNGLPWEDN